MNKTTIYASSTTNSQPRSDPNISNDMVCFCQQVDRHTIAEAMRLGANDLLTICQQTGAGSQCGSCHIYIKELLGENLWQSVKVASWHRYSENYCALRFAPSVADKPWSTEKPGAYFILQAQIEGKWVGRPYAITDDGASSGLREITIKRKQSGFFSNWIFNHLDSLDELPLRISSCMGGSNFDITTSKSIVCLIGGVGITPVLALCRTLAKSKYPVEICIDYSASTEEDFFCREELEQLAQHCHLSVCFRQTRQQGRIQQTEVDELFKRYPKQPFYICGPEAFKSSLIQLLHQAHIRSEQIIDLEATQTPAKPELANLNNVQWDYRLLGLALLLGYILQTLLEFKLPELEELQADDDYKIFSGLLLIIYLLNQWSLPLSRWLHRNKEQIALKKHSHLYFGAIAPLVLYLHASSFGHAYLAVLASVFLANSLLGICSGEFIPTAYRKPYIFGWTVMHVCLSTSLLFLSTYHAYIALAYK